MPTRKKFFRRGMLDGLPIAVGYFAVAFALGIKAVAAGFSPAESAWLSALNVTSAGEAAGIALLGAGTTYVELAFTQFVINIRYLLMSCALSQKIAPETSFLHRMLIGYGVTDEIFGICSAEEGKLSPWYAYGAIAVAVPGWTAGTVLGALLGGVLPGNITRALGVALYAMFLAIILPPARKSRVLAGIVLFSMAASFGLAKSSEAVLPALTEGFRIVILTVVISLAAALLFPVREEVTET